jgi:hypothetical protein
MAAVRDPRRAMPAVTRLTRPRHQEFRTRCLGYNHHGKPVNITYMVPTKDLDDRKNFDNLGGVAAGMKINHTLAFPGEGADERRTHSHGLGPR